jgi:guanylate kinase
MIMKTIYLLLGSSGVGKTTLGNYLKQMGIPELISTTTRPPRKGEVHGENYYFVTPKEFIDTPMVEFTPYDASGFVYGTSQAEIDRVSSFSDVCFAIVDKIGVEQYREKFEDKVKVIYIYAPPIILMDRMTKRGDPMEKINQRIRHAVSTRENENIKLADFCIVNKDLDSAVRQLWAIVGV